MEKSFAFFTGKNCKKTSLSSERNPTTVAEIIIKTVQQKYYYETARRERRTVLTVGKRKSSSFMRRLSKYKQKLDNWCIDHDVKHKVKGFYWIKN